MPRRYQCTKSAVDSVDIKAAMTQGGENFISHGAPTPRESCRSANRSKRYSSLPQYIRQHSVGIGLSAVVNAGEMVKPCSSVPTTYTMVALRNHSKHAGVMHDPRERCHHVAATDTSTLSFRRRPCTFYSRFAPEHPQSRAVKSPIKAHAAEQRAPAPAPVRGRRHDVRRRLSMDDVSPARPGETANRTYHVLHNTRNASMSASCSPCAWSLVIQRGSGYSAAGRVRFRRQ